MKPMDLKGYKCCGFSASYANQRRRTPLRIVKMMSGEKEERLDVRLCEAIKQADIDVTFSLRTRLTDRFSAHKDRIDKLPRDVLEDLRYIDVVFVPPLSQEQTDNMHRRMLRMIEENKASLDLIEPILNELLKAKTQSK